MSDNDNHDGQDGQNTKVTNQSPANDPQAPDPEQVNRDNQTSRQGDADPRDDDPVRRAITGGNAGLDNDPANLPRAVDGKPKRPTAYATEDEVISGEAHPLTGQPAKMDSFGRSGDTPQPRPTMTPDLAEPLNNPAGRGPQGVADAGETTARLHAAMRATGARNYGLLDAPDGSGPQSAAAQPSGGSSSNVSPEVGTVTDPAQAAEMAKSKSGTLHEIMSDVESAVSWPVHEIEKLIAEIKFLMGVAKKASTPAPAPKAA